MRKLLAFVAALFLLAPVARATEPTKVETLPNGLRVAWFVDDRLPLVDIVVSVAAGYQYEAPGKAGAAALLSSLIDKGYGGRSAYEVARATERLGASRFSSLDDDVFTYGAHGLSADAATLARHVADTVIRPDLPQSEFGKELSRVADGWGHLADSPESLAGVVLGRALSFGTVYGRGGFMGLKEFRALKREDAVAFHRDRFRPDLAALAVVGRVDPAAFGPVIREAFGAWVRPETPARAAVAAAADPRFKLPAGKRGFLVHVPFLNQAQVRIGRTAPAQADPASAAIELAGTLLGDYHASRLVRELRDEGGLTYSVGAGLAFSRNLARFSITTVTPNEGVGPLLERALATLGTLGAEKLPASEALQREVKAAQDYYAGSQAVKLASPSNVAGRWLTAQLQGAKHVSLEEQIARVRAVTPAELVQAAKKHLAPDSMILVVVGDEARISKNLPPALKGKLVRMTPAELIGK